MRLLFLFLILGITVNAYADRVCIEKSTGKLIEYQSGDGPLGVLTKNAISSGYKKEDVEEKYVTKEEWVDMRKTQIDNPAKAEKELKKVEKKAALDKLKTLGLSDDDLKVLFE